MTTATDGVDLSFYKFVTDAELFVGPNGKLEISTAPTKGSCGNQLIRSWLSKTKKAIGSGSDPESQASRQSDNYGGWCLELRRAERYGEVDLLTVNILVLMTSRRIDLLRSIDGCG